MTPRPLRSTSPEPLALSLQDGAASLAISLASLKRLIADGRLRTVRLGRRRVVIPVDELKRILSKKSEAVGTST